MLRTRLSSWSGPVEQLIADGGRAELLQRLHGLDAGPAEIAAAVGLHRHAAQDRQGADALRRLEGDGHLVDAEHSLHDEQISPASANAVICSV